jgi:hypothetical protein
MPVISTCTIRSLKKFIEFVENQMNRAKTTLWYRGCGKSTYQLKPSLFRHPTKTAIADIVDIETNLMNRFYSRSVPFLEHGLQKGWESLFLAQHYGVPTRLLDWSENPLIGLYFALRYSPHHFISGNIVYESDVAVWMFNPIEWNKHALNNHAINSVLGSDDDPLKGYATTADYRQLNLNPVALYGIHNSHRIVAQRGTFTIFGQDTRPMEDIYINSSYSPNLLIKIVFQKGFLPKINSSLFEIGITDSVVFPDLDGLSRELKRHFKFEV